MNLSFEVTRRKLQLGTRDSVTGWYARNFTESTIEMIIVDRGATQIRLPAGAYVRLDAWGGTADPVVEGDQIRTEAGKYYEVKAVKEVWGPGDNFVRRDCDLSSLPLHGLTFTDTTPLVEDARYRTKVYWETYVDSTKVNDHSFIVAYNDPDYPIYRVFVTKGIHIVLAVELSRSEPLLQHDLTAYGYMEHVATHVLSLDVELNNLMVQELRRVTRLYPLGSRRRLEVEEPLHKPLGSATMYDTKCVLNYRRDTT